MPILDREQIQQCIPHREPFLWLDEVTELNEKRIVARKLLDRRLDVFAGHYPQHPVLPGVLLCEMAFQAAAVLMSKKCAAAADGQVPVVTRLNNAKFRRMVRPGETVEIEVELTERLANAYFFTARLTAENQVAARLEFACALAEMA